MILRASSLLLIYAAILPGCTALKLGKPSRIAEEPVSLPTLWAQSSSGTEGKIATGWLETFRDKEMEKLVDEAMRNNHDLRATAARLRSAREGTITGRSNRLPQVSVSGSGSRSGSRFQEEDGDLSDWPAEVQANALQQVHYGDGIDGPKDALAFWRGGYDAQLGVLYFGITMADDDYVKTPDDGHYSTHDFQVL